MFDAQKYELTVLFNKHALRQFGTICKGEDMNERVNSILEIMHKVDKPMSVRDLLHNPHIDDTKSGIKYILETLTWSGFLCSETREEETIEIDWLVTKWYSDWECTKEVPETIKEFLPDWGVSILKHNPEASYSREVNTKRSVIVKREYYWINPKKVLG